MREPLKIQEKAPSIEMGPREGKGVGGIQHPGVLRQQEGAFHCHSLTSNHKCFALAYM